MAGYYPDDFKSEIMQWAADRGITIIPPETMVYFLLGKPAVQKFLQNADIDPTLFEEQVQRLHESWNQSIKRISNSEIPGEEWKNTTSQEPRFSAADTTFDRVAGEITALRTRKITPDEVDMFAAVIENSKTFPQLWNISNKMGVDKLCQQRLQRNLPPKAPSATHAQPNPPKTSELVNAFKDPEFQSIIKNLLRDAVAEGIEQHEAKQAREVGDAMTKSWTQRS